MERLGSFRVFVSTIVLRCVYRFDARLSWSNRLAREAMAQTIDDEVSCTAYGAAGLELWYSGQTWGETLCEPCYEARVISGQARPQAG